MAWTKQLFLVARKVDAELQQTSEYYKIQYCLLNRRKFQKINFHKKYMCSVVKDDDIIGGE